MNIHKVYFLNVHHDKKFATVEKYVLFMRTNQVLLYMYKSHFNSILWEWLVPGTLCSSIFFRNFTGIKIVYTVGCSSFYTYIGVWTGLPPQTCWQHAKKTRRLSQIQWRIHQILNLHLCYHLCMYCWWIIDELCWKHLMK